MITPKERSRLVNAIEKEVKKRSFVLLSVEDNETGVEIITNMPLDMAVLISETFTKSVKNKQAVVMNTN